MVSGDVPQAWMREAKSYTDNHEIKSKRIKKKLLMYHQVLQCLQKKQLGGKQFRYLKMRGKQPTSIPCGEQQCSTQTGAHPF